MANEAEITGGELRNRHGTWKVRRRIIFSALIFCAMCVAYITFMGEDTRVNESIILGSFGLAGAVISAYCFGAVWDDKTTRIHQIGGPSTEINTIAPSSDRRERAKRRLERMRRDKGVDNPDG